MTSNPHEALLPAGWARPRGFSHAIRAGTGRTLFIAGQVGAAPGTGPVPANSAFGEQYAQALRNVLGLVGEARGGPEHITLLRIYVTSLAAFREAGEAVGQAWRELFGRNYPAMTLVEVSGLLDPAALVEIEGIAVVDA